MAKVCTQCGKKPSTGSNISHSHRRTKRRYLPNLVEKRIYDSVAGQFTRKKMCTRCLRTYAKRQED